jgi:hypothetical protein
MIDFSKELKNKLLQKLYNIKLKDFNNRSKINFLQKLTEQDKQELGITATVRLMSNFPGLWQRTIDQTPNGSCVMGNTLFVASGPGDIYLILNSVLDKETRLMPPELDNVPKDRIWGLHMEPAEYIQKLGYNTLTEHRRVGRFYTNDHSLYKTGGIYIPSPPFVHWHTGKTFDFHSKTLIPEKKIDIGIIVSDLTTLEGHKKRLQFVEKLDSSGLNVAIWGRGNGLKRFKNYKGFVLNKWSAHSISKFTVVMENSIAPYYWSEKVADCILSDSIPFYYGCPNLDDYIPKNSFIKIDIDSPEAYGHLVEKIQKYDKDSHYQSVLEAKSLILSKYNLYSFIDAEIRKYRMANYAAQPHI